MRDQYPDFYRLADGLLAGNAELVPPNSDGPEFGKQPITPGPLDGANVVTSRVGVGNTHRVAIDLDLDAALVPSSTPGHHHLYIGRDMPWEQYVKLLDVLKEVGVIQPGYHKASIARGATVLRVPWEKK